MLLLIQSQFLKDGALKPKNYSLGIYVIIQMYLYQEVQGIYHAIFNISQSIQRDLNTQLPHFTNMLRAS